MSTLLEMQIDEMGEEISGLEREVLELKEELALERSKAVSRGEFIGNVLVGVDWDKETYEKAKAWDDLVKSIDACGAVDLECYEEVICEIVENALASIKGK